MKTRASRKGIAIAARDPRCGRDSSSGADRSELRGPHGHGRVPMPGAANRNPITTEVTVRKLIESMMGGQIELESVEGQGTLAWFTVTFQKAKEAAVGDCQANGDHHDPMAKFSEADAQRDDGPQTAVIRSESLSFFRPIGQ